VSNRSRKYNVTHVRWVGRPPAGDLRRLDYLTTATRDGGEIFFLRKSRRVVTDTTGYVRLPRPVQLEDNEELLLGSEGRIRIVVKKERICPMPAMPIKVVPLPEPQEEDRDEAARQLEKSRAGTGGEDGDREPSLSDQELPYMARDFRSFPVGVMGRYRDPLGEEPDPLSRPLRIPGFGAPDPGKDPTLLDTHRSAASEEDRSDLPVPETSKTWKELGLTAEHADSPCFAGDLRIPECTLPSEHPAGDAGSDGKQPQSTAKVGGGDEESGSEEDPPEDSEQSTGEDDDEGEEDPPTG